MTRRDDSRPGNGRPRVGGGARAKRRSAARHHARRGRRRRPDIGGRRLVRNSQSRRGRAGRLARFYAALKAGAPSRSPSSRSPPIRSARAASATSIRHRQEKVAAAVLVSDD